MPAMITSNIVIQSFVKVHGSTYDYSKLTYKNARTKVEIVCKDHGSFWQSVSNHKKGKGCPECAGNRKKHFKI